MFDHGGMAAEPAVALRTPELPPPALDVVASESAAVEGAAAVEGIAVGGLAAGGVGVAARHVVVGGVAAGHVAVGGVAVEGVVRGGAALRELAERVRPVELRSQQPTLAVVPGLEPLLPGGLVKGTTVAVGSVAGVGGATTLALALAAGPSRAGAWVALVGGDGGGMWGLAAAAGLGVALERLVVVAPGDRPASGWGPVVAAMVEGFPVVVVGPKVPLRPGDGRRLAARLRERGGVLVRVGNASVPSSAHVRLRVTEGEWMGIEAGAGYLRSRRVAVEATGRGAASRLRRCHLLLPGPTGEITPTTPG